MIPSAKHIMFTIFRYYGLVYWERGAFLPVTTKDNEVDPELIV